MDDKDAEFERDNEERAVEEIAGDLPEAHVEVPVSAVIAAFRAIRGLFGGWRS